MGASLEQAERSGGGAQSPPEPEQPAARSSAAGGFSLLGRAPALVLLAIVIADAMRSADTDLWGHVFFGRLVLSQHQLWFHAPFSYACPPGPRTWIMHDWLGNVLMALVYEAGGVVGLKLAKLACVAAMFALLARAMSETRAALEVQSVVVLAAALAVLPLMQFRTNLADAVMLAALVGVLARDSYRGDRSDDRARSEGPRYGGVRPAILIPMFALWANLHGGFFVGLAALALYAAMRGIQDLAAGAGARTALGLGAVSAAAALATLVNPYGLRDWLVIAGVLRNPFTLAHISEFQPLLAVVAQRYRDGAPLFPFVCALAIMAGLLVTFILAPRADDLALFAIGALMTVAALYAVRNTALAVIAAVVPLCRHSDLLVGQRAQSRAGDPRARPYPLLQVALAAAAALLALRTGLLSNRLPAVEDKPVGAVNFMREHGLHGNVLCEFGWADYLLWHDAAHSRIFIESLFEAYYPPTLQRDYATFYYAKPGAARVLDAYANDYVLMPTGSPADKLMMTQGGWRLIYRDPVTALFARTDSSATRLAGVPVVNNTAPPSAFP